MSAVRGKLNSQAGVAMVIALVFFLLCIMVGVVIVTAATVSAGSVALERETWQETEALTSAAQLLADDVKDLRFTGAYTKTETVTTTVTQDGDNNTTTDKATQLDTAFDTANTVLTGSLLTDYQANMIALYQQDKGLTETAAGAIGPITLSFTASAKDAESKEVELNIPKVKCTLTMAEDYTITAVLTCEDGSSTLTMVFQPQVSDSTKTAKPTTEQSPSDDGTSSTAVKTTVTTYTTTITWDDPVITEGGAAA